MHKKSLIRMSLSLVVNRAGCMKSGHDHCRVFWLGESSNRRERSQA